MAGPKTTGGDLVIVESPAKAKTIERYLGDGYRVLASYGHVRDLPKRGLGVDLENDFAPRYEPLPDRRDELKRLTDAARAAGRVWLATDLDRPAFGNKRYPDPVMTWIGPPILRVSDLINPIPLAISAQVR